MVLVRNVQKHSIASQRPKFFSLTRCCQSQRFTGIQKYGNDKRAHQLHLWSKRYVALSPNWLQLCKSCSGLPNPWEDLRFRAMMWNNCSEVLNKACYGTQLLPFYLDLHLDGIGAVCHQLVSSALIFIFLSYSIYVLGKPQIHNISAAYANLSIMFFRSMRHGPFNINDEAGRWQETSFPDPVLNHFPMELGP